MEMSNKSAFNDYQFANVSEADLKKITELEHNIGDSTKEDVILIAYKNSQMNTQK
ncbi:MAG: hypothetical protein K0S04_2268 [Herbinix sp.]|jgi:hypothetical protein|nr:hypothetical protein [Herbinix sp.]